MNTPGRAAAIGAVVCTLGAFPAAALVALVYRFPIPLAAYASGPEAVLPSMLAVIFYGIIIGGFVVLPCLGAVAGLVAYRLAKPNSKMILCWTIALAFAVDLLAAMTLATWDKIYGPW